MAENTNNLNLKKPAPEDFYNIEDFNENFQKIDDFASEMTAAKTNSDNHIADTDNPHSVTKEQIGLGYVTITTNDVAVGYGAEVTNGGVAVGYNAVASGGGAVGKNAEATDGGAVGGGAKTAIGGAVGASAKATRGGAVGHIAEATSGGAVGYNAKTEHGGAVGENAQALLGGGAVGYCAETLMGGGAVGYGTGSSFGGAVGYDADATNGGAVGYNADATSGGAVGENAEATSGGAIGENAEATSGGAIGASAKALNGGAVGENAEAEAGFSGGAFAKATVDAIQLGTGTNPNEYTLQVYDYQLMDANGKIPPERLYTVRGAYTGTGTYGKDNPNTLTFDFEVEYIIFFGREKGTPSILHRTDNTLYTVGWGQCPVTWNGNSISWYNDGDYYSFGSLGSSGSGSAERQANISGQTYYYVAVKKL